MHQESQILAMENKDSTELLRHFEYVISMIKEIKDHVQREREREKREKEKSLVSKRRLLIA